MKRIISILILILLIVGGLVYKSYLDLNAHFLKTFENLPTETQIKVLDVLADIDVAKHNDNPLSAATVEDEDKSYVSYPVYKDDGIYDVTYTENTGVTK